MHDDMNEQVPLLSVFHVTVSQQSPNTFKQFVFLNAAHWSLVVPVWLLHSAGCSLHWTPSNSSQTGRIVQMLPSRHRLSLIDHSASSRTSSTPLPIDILPEITIFIASAVSFAAAHPSVQMNGMSSPLMSYTLNSPYHPLFFPPVTSMCEILLGKQNDSSYSFFKSPLSSRG